MAVFSERAIFSLAVASCHFLGALLLTTVLGRLKRFNTIDWLIVLWLAYDVIVHLTLVSQSRHQHAPMLFYVIQEGPFLYFSLTGTVLKSEGILANVCMYAKPHLLTLTLTHL